MSRPVSCASSDSKYQFTKDWVRVRTSTWEETLQHLKGKPDVHGLEVGSFEGRSAIWFVENVHTHPSSSMTCVDIFSRKKIEKRFDHNVQATGVAGKFIKIKGPTVRRSVLFDVGAAGPYASFLLYSLFHSNVLGREAPNTTASSAGNSAST